MSAKENEDWFKTPSAGFGDFTDADDFLHPQEVVEGDTLTETQYFGFNIPEENIYGFSYFWLHPNLDVVTGGLFACQGLKNSSMQAELFDMHAYVSKDRVITNDLQAYEFPNSYAVKVLEPGKRMRIAYNDEARGNRLDMEATAIMPVAMRGNNKHFEQGMKNSGELVLRGKRYSLDNTYAVRDRSWGQLRPEDNTAMPPMTWLTGTFGDDFAFNCNCADHPDLSPDWSGVLEMPAENTFHDGWIFENGELVRLKSARKSTRRDPQTGRPLRHDIQAQAADGSTYHITGEITAGLPWSGWPNMVCQLYLTRWECKGRTGWGDTQEVQWNDYVYNCTGNK